MGIAHHLGWAITVTATSDCRVADRRRIALVDEALPAAPIHHHGGAHPMHADGERLDDDALAQLVETVRASTIEHARRAFDELADDLPGPIVSISVRSWPDDLPTEITDLRRAPDESQADSVMYREILAREASARDWIVHRFDATTVEREAAAALGDGGAHMRVQRSVLGPPWNEDHRIAFAAAILAALGHSGG